MRFFNPFYSSLHELPILVWDEINKTSNKALLIKSEYFKNKYISKEKLNTVYTKLLNDYLVLKEPKQYVENLQKQYEIEQLTFDWLTSNKKTLKSIINLKKMEYENYLNDKAIELEEDTSVTENIIAIERIMKTSINPVELSTYKYITYLDVIKKQYGNK